MRIAGVDIPNDKRVVVALTYIYGIGSKTASHICQKAGISPETRVKSLGEDQGIKLRGIIENEIKVEGEELQQAALREAMRFPGQERKVLDFFRSNAAALEQLRAPIFEDKVCDFIFTQAKVSDETVTPEELMKDPDEDEAPDTEAKPAEAPAAEAKSDEATATT